MMEERPAAPSPEDEFVGYREAARYLGIAPDTLSSYMSKGEGPHSHRRQAVRQYNMRVFTRAALDEWREKRPGQGSRTDLAHASSAS